MKEDSQSDSGAKRRDVANIVIWTVIGFFFALTAVWVVWASKQPRIRSLWTPDDQ
jgi:hypothetical protein